MSIISTLTSSQQNSLGSSGLQKLTIVYDKYQECDWKGAVEVLFNPQELSINQSIQWQTLGGSGEKDEIAIEQRFQSFVPQKLTLNLFFDSYESHDTLLGSPTTFSTISAPQATDVRQYTDAINELATVKEELHRPPICKLQWGEFDNLFCGVVTQMNRKFTMFMANGMPVRATVTVSFVEYSTKSNSIEQHSADIDKRHTVRPRETLHTIAAQQYNNPALWRHIARANGIANPRTLRPGTQLIIPKLT